jgi:hypothetical protein
MWAIDSPAKADSRFWMVAEAGLWKGFAMMFLLEVCAFGLDGDHRTAWSSMLEVDCFNCLD